MSANYYTGDDGVVHFKDPKKPYLFDDALQDVAVVGEAVGPLYVLVNGREEPVTLVFELNIKLTRNISRGLYPVSGIMTVDHVNGVSRISFEVKKECVSSLSVMGLHSTSLTSGGFFFNDHSFSYEFSLFGSCLYVLSESEYSLEGTLTTAGICNQTMTIRVTLKCKD